MGRIILRTALAVLSVGFFTLAIITELYPSALMGWPVWVWYALAGATCVALSLTWIRVKPSKWAEIIGLKLKLWGLQLLIWVIKRRTFQYLVLRPFALGLMSWIIWKVFTDPDRLNASVGDPQVAEMLVQIKATLDKVAEYPTNDAERECRISCDWTHLISSEWDHPISG